MPASPEFRGADDDARAGVVVAFAVYLLWGLLTLYWKLLSDFDAIELIGWRIAASALLMSAILTVSGGSGRPGWQRLAVVVRDRALLGRVIAAALLLTVNWTAYVYAVVHDHVIETALGYFIAPLGTILIGVVVFREHLARAQQIAVALALVALAILTVSYGRMPWLALAIAVSWSVYGWIKKSVPLSPVESMSAESLLLVVPATVVVIVMWGRSGSVADTATAGELALVVATGIATVVPLMMFAWAAQRVRLTLLGPMQYLIPTINFLLGWLLYDEAMPASRLAGFALVWVGLALVTVDALRRARAARSALSLQEPIPV